jgi:LmbE family N-acetylglucosaminyl deacetylase
MPAALAIFCHPDDIEFVAAGTLLQLRAAGWDVHYMNVASGNLGSASMSSDEARVVRLAESQRAAEVLGAHWHAGLCDDLEVVYSVPLVRRLVAVVRDVSPEILLTHAPIDYMEDHMATARLAVTAAFSRGMPNFTSHPEVAAIAGDVTVYHAQPHLNRDPLGEVVRPTHFVETSSVMEAKRTALAAHESQQQWLDASQAMSSYVQTMEELGREVGQMSGAFTYAEGWRRRLHAGYCTPDADPLRAALEPRGVLLHRTWTRT